MELTRREFLKTSAATATASAAGISVPAAALATSKQAEADIQWDKGVCRFCGTGCGIMVGTRDGRVVYLRNDFGHRKHWVTVQLEGQDSNSHGLGSRVTITTEAGDQVRGDLPIEVNVDSGADEPLVARRREPRLLPAALGRAQRG